MHNQEVGTKKTVLKTILIYYNRKCYKIKTISGDPVYATSFVPTYGAITAHHIKLYSCRPGNCFFAHPLNIQHNFVAFCTLSLDLSHSLSIFQKLFFLI